MSQRLTATQRIGLAVAKEYVTTTGAHRWLYPVEYVNYLTENAGVDKSDIPVITDRLVRDGVAEYAFAYGVRSATPDADFIEVDGPFKTDPNGFL